MPKCPLCGFDLIEELRSVSVKGVASGSSVSCASLDAYYGSADVYVINIHATPGSEMRIRYYKCSNRDCPYLKRRIEK
jgi:hypothetical protein